MRLKVLMGDYVNGIIDHSGMGCLMVEVECHIANGLPSISIIGYGSKAVEEARDRLRASFSSSHIQLPKRKITINLAPAEVPKDTTALDLAMAVAIFAAAEQIDSSRLTGCAFLGELGLNGSLRPVRGVVGKLIEAKKRGLKTVYMPADNFEQANLVPGMGIKVAADLRQVYLDLSGTLPLKTRTTDGHYDKLKSSVEEVLDISEISGQPIAKRAVEIAAAGHHNLLLHGPPGTGKTMLGKAMRGILPDLSPSEVLEVTHLHSLGSAGSEVITQRPFRSPHHTASTVAIIGGGTNPKPGEASLAHRGILFLDELPEFSRDCLESLRQPLEDGFITIARAKESVTYPAAFIMVATQNPCPCGYLGSNKPCSCTASAIARYRKKVSGPILDRIDLHLAVSGVEHRQLLKPKGEEKSPGLRKEIEEVYAVQRRRFNGKDRFNSSMTNKEIRQLAQLSAAAKELLDVAAAKLDLSARAYVRSVKVARTIADLASSATIVPEHISEALQYRQPIEDI